MDVQCFEPLQQAIVMDVSPDSCMLLLMDHLSENLKSNGTRLIIIHIYCL
jgi:hypothetical protein